VYRTDIQRPQFLFNGQFNYTMILIQSTSNVVGTVLPLLLIYTIFGNIILFPVFFSLIVYTTVEALHIFNNVSRRLDEEERQRVERLRQDETALITARITEELKQKNEKEITLLRGQRDFAESGCNEEFVKVFRQICKDAAFQQSTA
jgi:hypothetical protein